MKWHLWVWLCLGCTNVVTEIVVKDPAAVSVRVANPDGVGAEILPATRAPAEVEIPKTNPPYTPGVVFAASAIRHDRGGITLRCDACAGTPTLDVLGDDGRIYEDGPWESVATPKPVLTIYGNDAVISHIEYPYVVPAGKSVSHRVAFDVDLVTPTSNLVSARRDGGDTHTAGMWALGAGVVLVATSIAMFVVASDASSTDRGKEIGFITLGSLTALWGLAAVAGGISLATNPVIHQHEWPRP